MTLPLFNLDRGRELPLWAQVLLAARLLRRAVLALPAAGGTGQALLAGCDALEACARAGERLQAHRATLTRAAALDEAMHWAADAALAASDSLDFSAAEAACINSAWNAINLATGSAGLTALQARIYLAADIDQLEFACREARIGRYDALGDAVFGRLAPVYPPETASSV